MTDRADEIVDTVIVGGGLAGLTAAVALVDRGVSVCVLEATETLGGRARSWTDPVTGDPVHIGPHIFLTDYPNVWKLLERLGTRDKIVWQRPGRFLTMVDGRRLTEIKDGGLPPPYHYVPSLLRAPEVSLADLLSNWVVTSLALAMDEDDVLALDEEDALSVLRRLGVTRRFIDWYWRFTALAIMNVPLEECSAGALLRFYQYQVSRRATRVGFADGGLGDVFCPAACAAIEGGGGEVRTGARVRELVTEPGGRVAGVVTDDGARVSAHHVILALPPRATGRVIPERWRSVEAFSRLDRFIDVPYVSVYLWYDRKLTRRAFWARAWRPDDLNCDFYDLSNIHRDWEDRPSLVCSNIIWSHRAHGLSDAEIVAATRREIAELLPDERAATLRHFVVNRIPMAIHAPHPGTERARPPVRPGIEGLLLASDWIATGVPSSMESAVRAGWLAAEAILEDRGRIETLACGYREPTGLAALYGRLPRRLSVDLPIAALDAVRRAAGAKPERPRWLARRSHFAGTALPSSRRTGSPTS